MNAARLCTIVQDVRLDMRGRAAAILCDASATSQPDLELAFTIALRSGALDGYAAAALLTHIQQIAPAECPEWRDDGELTALRKQLAELSTEAAQAAAFAPEQHTLQQRLAALTTLADSKRRDLAELQRAVAAYEQHIHDLDALTAEVPR
jgi:septal ring factor EnvC (AmiA/AmiB activator)